ncbi:MAG: hypothetical protein WDO16_15485 [Bacteroidota bacterium]
MTLFRRPVLVVFILALSVTFYSANAQLCQGSLGDPLVNITFGAGSNPGAPLAAATTSYQYISSDCPGDGFYTVRSNTSTSPVVLEVPGIVFPAIIPVTPTGTLC